MLTVACVWQRGKYHVGYVHALREMVRRRLREPFRFICLSDMNWDIEGVEFVDIRHLNLPRWWGKMALFSPAIRGPGRCLYLDLDMVLVDDITELAKFDGRFGICENFTRLAGNSQWPCRYGSCAMVFADGWGEEVWQGFQIVREPLMQACHRGGDQRAIEQLVPDATYLQDHVPPGFFLGYRDLHRHKLAPPDGTAIVVFAGKHTPETCQVPWVRDAWR